MFRVVLVLWGLTAVTVTISFAEDSTRICSYDTFTWSVPLQKSVAHQRIEHSYDSLRPEEVDPVTGCTVCEQDQEELVIPPLRPFRVCAKLAPAVRSALRELVGAGEPLFEVIGYRVGKTRGRVDEEGKRTGFSNHSFGIAVDINPGFNGLYDNCATFGPYCRLIRGGRWQPNLPGGLTAEGAIVKRLGAAGFRWGGEIQGRQKDFMHFSPSGY